MALDQSGPVWTRLGVKSMTSMHLQTCLNLTQLMKMQKCEKCKNVSHQLYSLHHAFLKIEVYSARIE